MVSSIGSLPDGGGNKVRAIRIRIADPLYDAEIALLEERPKKWHRSIQANVVAELDDFLLFLADTRTRFLIGIISKRNERVESIISASKLKHNKNGVVFASDWLDSEITSAFMKLPKGALDEHWNRPSGGCTENGGTEEITAVFHKISD